MNRDEVDHVLDRLRGERDRITAALLDLEAQQGYRLLQNPDLTGGTARRRDELGARMAELWRLFDAYGRVLGRAEELRNRRGRPDQADLAELARLLSGPSVELPTETPLERRTLLGPAAEHLSLDGVVARMTGGYEAAARAIASVDAAWSALLDRLDRADEAARGVRALVGSLGPDPEFDRLAAGLDRLRATVRTDPLSIGPDAFDDVDAGLALLRSRLEEAARVRAGHEERMTRVAATIGLIRAAEDEARRTRERVVAAIAAPLLPDLPVLSTALADRLAALATLRGRWTELADRLARLEEAAATGLEQTRTAVDLLTGLLDRRAELRGRLDAYHAKAGRLGYAEDPELTRLYAAARDLLWTSPCDLRRATAALADYQRAIGERR